VLLFISYGAKLLAVYTRKAPQRTKGEKYAFKLQGISSISALEVEV
jgi:hypothetical protein